MDVSERYGPNEYQTYSPPQEITCGIPGAKEKLLGDMAVGKAVKPVVSFLKKHGHKSIVSLGCGARINRIDNHIRLMTELNLSYYVCIDRLYEIEPISSRAFSDTEDMTEVLIRYYGGNPNNLFKAIKIFPGTLVEDLQDVSCAAVVCQRILPYCRWEDAIISMNPKLILQEDLHGCERQSFRGRGYVRTRSGIRRYGLKPFRPWPIFPGEYNMVFWRRKDFGVEKITNKHFLWFQRIIESLP
ncbi:MAG: hypothetical protein SRB2_03157 [Desulfobacteraceae bacterium Eth-SRB2]|nr:MAG: hypothetical protein SRB2_03157 [Desulfobacteraceae bacterium Eth-SRB2]